MVSWFLIGLRTVRIDMSTGRVVVQHLDGLARDCHIDSMADVVASVDADLVARTVRFELVDDGPTLTVDLPATVYALPPGPVVYLDQNHWINVARSILSPGRVEPKSELEPARMLVEAARKREITLPLSAGHIVERGRSQVTQRRRDLGRVMADLSRGWFMRHPTAVRREEVMKALRSGASQPIRSGVRGPVFTCSPVDLFSSKSTRDNPEPGSDYATHRAHGLTLEARVSRLIALCAVVATILDEGPTETGEVLTRAAGWAREHDDLSQFLGSTERTREQRQIAARTKVLVDLGDELKIWARASGMTATEFGEWFRDASQTGLPGLPYMGRVHEVVQRRLANSDDRWEANDLIDLHYLSCAAGYADVVVAESKHGNYLRLAGPRVTSGATVVTGLRDCLEPTGLG